MKNACFIVALSLLFGASCGTIPDKPPRPDGMIEIPETDDDSVEVNYEAQDPDRYAAYLVDIDNYTTSGDYFHRKHKQYLLGVSELLIKNYGYRLREGTVGFYFDKVEDKRDQLFLGLDIICDQNILAGGEGFVESGRRMINEYLANVLKTVHLYEEILRENQIEGAVIGLQWYRAGRGEIVNIWMSKQDINEYFNQQLSFNQLVLKSTITDRSGKKIRLTM